MTEFKNISFFDNLTANDNIAGKAVQIIVLKSA